MKKSISNLAEQSQVERNARPKNEVRLTQTTLRILFEFLRDVNRELSGADIWQTTKIGAGSRYPILARLEKAGWLTSTWENVDPRNEGRPRKRLYRLTMNGQAFARSALLEKGMAEGVSAWSR
jgi:PadR family transcriptional regulator, regulatory protein PadR